MQFQNHGLYTIEKRDRFFIIKYIGSWNEEAAEAMLTEFKGIVEDSGFSKFGILSDLREWEGSTPAALLVAKAGLDYLYEHGQIASLQICHSNFTKKLAEPINAIQRERMDYDVFENMEDAIICMQDLISNLS